MNILIDGYVFARQDEAELKQFWQQTIPKIVNQLPKEQVYFLNRTANPVFQETSPQFKNLFAPPVDFEQSAIEDRRLSALCQELNIDIFISTYYTSAGTAVKSLFVLCGKCSSDIFATDEHISRARQRAIKMASAYIAVFQEEVDNFSITYQIPTDISLVFDFIGNGEQWPIAIHNVLTQQLSTQIKNLHLAEEEAVKSEVASIRQAIEQAAIESWEKERTYNISVSNQKPQQTLSVCMMVQNSEKTLPLALESLAEVYDDLIIVDGGSTDSTCQIALSHGARIIYSKWTGNHSAQRNVYLKEVQTDWVFVIDSDEFIDQKTLDFLKFIKSNGSKIATDNFWVTRKWISPFNKNYYIAALPHYPDWQRRIFRYNKSISYSGQIHEEIHGLTHPGDALEDLTVYHLDLLIKSESEREAKVKKYSQVNLRDGMPHFYLPKTTELNVEKWQHEDLLTEVKRLLDAIPVKCKVCESDSLFLANAQVLEKYPVDYFQCSNCGFVQTEEPFWLQEAYSQAIADTDVGLVYRNLRFSSLVSKLIFNFFNHEGKFLDYGGGYGLFVRLMRDNGFDFYWLDKFCENIFAKYFKFIDQQDGQKMGLEMVTAFEVVEHLMNPVNEIAEILKYSKNFLFSTELLPDTGYYPHEWWYYSLSEGQHISLYTEKSLAIIAEKLGLNFYSNGLSLHLFTEKELPDNLFLQLVSPDLQEVQKKSLLQDDYIKAVNESNCKNAEFTSFKSVPDRDNNAIKSKIVIDGVFFQLYQTGIARVWKSLLEEWSKNGFAQYITVIDRAGTAPKIPGIKYVTVPPYDYKTTEEDREILQQVCDQEGADLFISSYYTTPITTPSVFMGYDMIPEVMGWDTQNNPMWQEKHYAIQQASAYIAISENTASDLVKHFPDISLDSVTIAHCGVSSQFSPAKAEEIHAFKVKYSITKPYFILVGTGTGYKNSILFFQAFAQLVTRYGFDIVITGSGGLLEPEFRAYTTGTIVHTLQLTDEELAIAYSGAVALVYPSKYEGFGMPIVEAMACGCPVITCPKASIPEAAGEAAIYVNDDDVEALVNALCEVQKTTIRNSLINAGLAQAKKFSWTKMAEKVSFTLIKSTLLSLNLKKINFIVFPDWSQPEELLGAELEEVIKSVLTHPDSDKTTLLLNKGNISTEDAELFLSGLMMNLLMTEDLDVSEELQISLVEDLAHIQWQVLLPQIKARIVLAAEDKQYLTQLSFIDIPAITLDTLREQSSE